MKRLIENTVFWGLVTACRLATWPTSRSPSFVNATTDGVTRPPSALGMTTGSPPSITATTELVVPRSMPMIFSAMTTAPYHEVDARDSSAVAQASGMPGKDANMTDWRRLGRFGKVWEVCSDADSTSPVLPNLPNLPVLSFPRDSLQRRESHRADAGHDRRHHRPERAGMAVRAGGRGAGSPGPLGVPTGADSGG